MENKKVNNKVMKALKNSRGLSISDMQRKLNIPRCQIRTAIAFLLGADKIEEQIYGKAKVYNEVVI